MLAPHHRRFAVGGVILEGVAKPVIPALEDAVFVVADRLGAHHPHPSQPGTPSLNGLHALPHNRTL